MPGTPSTRWSITKPADGDLISGWPGTMRSAIDAIDAVMLGLNTTLPRPSAALLGRFHRDSGTGVISFDTGTGWATVTQTPHAADHVEGGPDPVKGQIPIGGVIAYAGGSLPPGTEWDWADGGLIDKTTYATFFARVGHAYNLNVDPGSNKVRKPDKRGRVSMGADNFGPLGAANRVTVDPAARGFNGGLERITLAALESGVAVHGHTSPSHGHTAGTDSQLTATWIPLVPGNANMVSNFTGGASPGFNAPIADNSNPWSVQYLAHGHNITVNGTGVTVNSATAAAAANSHQNLPPHENDTYLVRIA